MNMISSFISHFVSETSRSFISSLYHLMKRDAPDDKGDAGNDSQGKCNGEVSEHHWISLFANIQSIKHWSRLLILELGELGLIVLEPQCPYCGKQCVENPASKECNGLGIRKNSKLLNGHFYQKIDKSTMERGTATKRVLLLGLFLGWTTRRHAWPRWSWPKTTRFPQIKFDMIVAIPRC